MATFALESIGGFHVQALASGEDALAHAVAFAPELLLLDVTLPGMDGPQTLAALRALPPLREVPAVFLTARTHARDVVQYRTLGVRDIVAKPFDPAQLCERVQAALASTGPSPPPRERGRTALVVEDDPATRYLLEFVLEQNGWHMVAIEDGEQARHAIDQGSLTDVVMLDIVLPGQSGLTLLEYLRSQARWQPVPVMMLTSKGDEALVKKALSLGADDYLGKPFDLAELTSRLNNLHRRR